MLENEKYMGNAVLRKSYTVDFLSKKRIKNDGQIQSYVIEENHDPIIDEETWDCVQMEMERREMYLKEHRINSYSHQTEKNPFASKIICGNCGRVFSRKGWKSGYEYRKVWQCSERYKEKGVLGCSNRHLDEDTITKVYIIAWNELVRNKEGLKAKWEKIIEGEDVLLKYKTKQIIKLVEIMSPLEEVDIDLMLKTLDIVRVYEDGRVVIKFYDGTEMEYQGQ